MVPLPNFVYLSMNTLRAILCAISIMKSYLSVEWWHSPLRLSLTTALQLFIVHKLNSKRKGMWLKWSLDSTEQLCRSSTVWMFNRTKLSSGVSFKIYKVSLNGSLLQHRSFLQFVHPLKLNVINGLIRHKMNSNISWSCYVLSPIPISSRDSKIFKIFCKSFQPRKGMLCLANNSLSKFQIHFIEYCFRSFNFSFFSRLREIRMPPRIILPLHWPFRLSKLSHVWLIYSKNL